MPGFCFETIRFSNGQAENLVFHQIRFQQTRAQLFNSADTIYLADILTPPADSGSKVLKCRITYGTDIQEISWTSYEMRPVNHLLMINSDDVDYGYKYNDRKLLTSLFECKGICDDVLIVKGGLITDTSIANVALGNGNDWYTPKTPLLPGTRRASLLHRGVIKPRKLTPAQVSDYPFIRLFNAMIPWELAPTLPTTNVHWK